MCEYETYNVTEVSLDVWLKKTKGYESGTVKYSPVVLVALRYESVGSSTVFFFPKKNQFFPQVPQINLFCRHFSTIWFVSFLYGGVGTLAGARFGVCGVQVFRKQLFQN